ncbi:MAG TPA: NUDIX domain-containing protein, partial [Bacteroidia bacterium]|nr:NUDIX domain-containing protein [Bacteroidia bacterium]
IASFAFNKIHAVVDGNVYRVLSRVFGIETPIDSSLGKKEFYKLANELIDKKNPGLHNQALMEFGAMQCKPANPDCSVCPLNTICYAFSKKVVADLPIKEKKTKVRSRYFNYLIFRNKGSIAIHKRTAKDIWINLHDFPLIETTKELSEEQLIKSPEWKKMLGKTKYSIKSISNPYKHILSHQKIYARFIEIECKEPLKSFLPKDVLIIKEKDIQKFAVPRLVDLYLEKR